MLPVLVRSRWAGKLVEEMELMHRVAAVAEVTAVTAVTAVVAEAAAAAAAAAAVTAAVVAAAVSVVVSVVVLVVLPLTGVQGRTKRSGGQSKSTIHRVDACVHVMWCTCAVRVVECMVYLSTVLRGGRGGALLF